MSQAQTVICLNEDQIKTVLNNMWNLRHLKEQEILYKGKPIFSKEIMDKYNYKHYTKFANNYVIYKCKSLEDNHIEIFITVETDHYDKQNILAICGFTHIIKEYLDNSKESRRPLINVCLCFVVTQGMYSHIPTVIFNTFSNVRVIQLCRLYPMLGSKTQTCGLTFNYRLLKQEENDLSTYNGKQFSIVDAGEPLAIALNAIDGDLLVYDRIIYDCTAYKDTQIKRVKDELEDLSLVPMSGILRYIPEDIINVQKSQL